MNHLTIDAKFLQFAGLRYNPAGLPIVECTLRHDSEQQEALVGKRKVVCVLLAVAFGEVALLLAEAYQKGTSDQWYRFQGFIAQRGKTGQAIEFHILNFSVFSER